MVDSTHPPISDRGIYIAAFNYVTGVLIPHGASNLLVKNGVGVLLWLPFQLLLMFLVTVPCLFMGLALGQYSNKAVVRIWDFCPIFRGVGYGSFVISIIYQIYYNFFCTYALIFTILSWRSNTEWKSCNNSWNTVNCYTFEDNITRRYQCSQKLSKEKCHQMEWETSMEQLLQNRLINLHKPSIHMGMPQYELLLYTLITVALIFLANSNGSKVFEKILIILAVVPTIQLLILLFTPLTYTSGLKGITSLFKKVERISKLKDVKVWLMMLDIASNGSGLGFGAYITLGTRCSFRSPLHFKSVLISFLVVLFTLISAITIENFLLNLCIQSNMIMDDIFAIKGVLPLPEAAFFMTHANRFWTTMWLLHRYLLGLRHMIVMMFLNVEVLCNSFPKARTHYTLCVFLFCVIIYGGGVSVSTKYGYMATSPIHEIIHSMVLPLFTALQLVAVVFCYGITNFQDDVCFMLGIRLSTYWKIVYFFNPILFIAEVSYNFKIFYEQKDVFKFNWIKICQHTTLYFSLFFIVSYAFFYVIKTVRHKNFRIFSSSQNWGPRESLLNKSRHMFVVHKMTKEYLYRQERFKSSQQPDEREAE